MVLATTHAVDDLAIRPAFFQGDVVHHALSLRIALQASRTLGLSSLFLTCFEDSEQAEAFCSPF